VGAGAQAGVRTEPGRAAEVHRKSPRCWLTGGGTVKVKEIGEKLLDSEKAMEAGSPAYPYACPVTYKGIVRQGVK